MALPSTTADLKAYLGDRFIGKNLNDVPTPSIVLDLARVTVNCNLMLDATAKLGLLWRAHIKTHKTTELTRLQVGSDPSRPVQIMTSTVLEAENIANLLKEYQSAGRSVNLLYAFPLPPSLTPRLATLSSLLGPRSLSLLIDHPSQLASLSSLPHPPLLFLKIDTSYGRAGVVPNSSECHALIDAVLESEKKGHCVFHGLYSHAGHSYGARTEAEALGYLAKEFEGLKDVVGGVRERTVGREKGLVLSVGATPTATTIQGGKFQGGDGEEGERVMSILEGLKSDGFQLEVHAGVYPTLDLQQLATHARDASLMTVDDIAVTVLAEVASVYPNRGQNSSPEALIAAGSLALGREPVADKGTPPGKSYSGWGILAPWGAARSNPIPGPGFPQEHGGWQVGRISQEHGILTWDGAEGEAIPDLKVGDKVRVWPNHSCIAGAGFDYYLVVDGGDEVVDVWVRWRGW